jgi:transposase
MSSGNLNDGRAAIPLLKGIEKLPISIEYGTMDAGYDLLQIYQQIHQMGAYSMITYNKCNGREIASIFCTHMRPRIPI